MLKTLLALALFTNISPLDENQLTQYSTIDALLSGVYDGNMSVAELKTRGDFGLGTFNGIDGEMIIVDGVVYQIPAEGKATVASDSMLSPFATVCHFKPQKQATLEGPSDADEVRSMIKSRMFSSENVFYAIRMDGTFTHVKARSPRKQKQPYNTIDQVIASQAIFEFKDIEGTMLGFWCPKYLSGLNVGGWHLHFISKDRTQGGHVLDFSIGKVDTSVMEMMRFEILLPRETEFFNASLDLDRAEILHQVEVDQGIEMAPATAQ